MSRPIQSGTDTLQVAELDVLARDVAADAVADGAVRRLRGELVEVFLPDIRVLGQQFVELRRG
jgi:hypothetical protein